MVKQILEAVNEMECENLKTLEDCLEYYSPSDLIDIWLRYEGIRGYSEDIRELYELFFILIPKELKREV